MAREIRVGWLAVAWGTCAVPLLVLFALSVPALHARRSQPSEPVRVGLEQLGISTASYALWWSGVLLLFGLVCFGVAALVVARLPRAPAAWFAALLLVALGAANAPSMEALVWQRPSLGAAATAAFQLLLACFVLFLLTFPDGRFSPSWSWAVVPVVVAAMAVARGSVAGPVSGALFGALLVGLVGGLAAQVHRYRRVSTPEQRQQTRWVTAALVVAVAAQLLFPLLEGVPALARPGAGAALLDMASPAGVSAGYALLPATLAMALLRRRLWGLSVVVDRTLVYGALTAGLLALYLAVAVGLGRAFGQPGETVGSVLAAAVVAVAFAPLRQRIQRGVDRLLYGRRDDPYEVLSGLGQRLEATVAPGAVLQTVVDTVASTTRSPYVAIAVPALDGLRVAACAGRPAADPLVLPLVHRHQRVGELRVAPRSPAEHWNAADRALLEDLGRQAGAAVHAVQLTAELQASRERLVTAREEERRRLRRDLHDGLGPALASMTLQAESAAELVPSQPEVATAVLSDLVQQLQSSTAEIRRLVYELRPPALDDLGLVEALRVFLARSRSSGVRLDLCVPDGVPPLTAAAEVAVYRIVQEAVVNVLRHARARECVVTLRAEDDGLVVEVSDDGVGLPGAVAEGVGLRSMRERSAELGGTCAVQGRPGAGTHVVVRLPRPAPAPAAR